MTLNNKAFNCSWSIFWITIDSIFLWKWITVEWYTHSLWLSILIICLLIGTIFWLLFEFFKALFTEVKK